MLGVKKSLADLFPGPSIGQLAFGIEQAIAASFVQQGMRNPTQAEVRRRFGICMKWAEQLRGDLGWGVTRIVDSLRNILAVELSGGTWTPSDRMCWVPSDGN